MGVSVSGDAPFGVRQKLVLIAGAVLFACLLGECGLRSYDAYRGIGFWSGHRNLIAQHVLKVRPFLIFGFDPYRERDGEILISSRHGELFPFEKPEGSLRIVCFGGSSTENGWNFEQSRTHYPLVLQRKLRKATGRTDVEVINVGNAAYSTAHSLILLELNVLSWRPDVVILSHNINDLTAGYFPDFRVDYSHKFSNPYYLPDFASRYTLTSLLLQDWQLFWLVRDRVQMALSRHPIQRTSYGHTPPAAAAASFERNVRSFVALAQANGIRAVLGGQAIEPSEEFFERHVSQKDYNDIVRYPLHDEFLSHHDDYNRIMERVANEVGAGFVPNSTWLGGRRELFVDFVHYTDQGIEELAKSYSSFLLDNLPRDAEERPVASAD
jgi:lysophospholipase L1-like esterase